MVNARSQPSVPFSFRMYVLVVIVVRKNPQTWETDFLAADSITARGYTMHSLFPSFGKHWDKFSLINMNGRVYDPAVARFLSPDPVDNKMSGTQGLNRYSYVLNNPTKYTDPSGYQPAISIYYENNNGGGLSTGVGEAIANSFRQVRHLNNMSNLRMEGFMERSIGYTYDWERNTLVNKGEKVGFIQGKNTPNYTQYTGVAAQDLFRMMKKGYSLKFALSTVKSMYTRSLATASLNGNFGGDGESNPYKIAENVYYGGMALGASLYLIDGPQIGPEDAAGATYQAATIATAGLIFTGTYLYSKMHTTQPDPGKFPYNDSYNNNQNNPFDGRGKKVAKWILRIVGGMTAANLKRCNEFLNYYHPPAENTRMQERQPVYDSLYYEQH